jgi:hypothetical protein
MNIAKFDAALNSRLVQQRDQDINVSVRLRSQLTPEEVTRLQAMGLDDADTRRRVLFGTLSPKSLAILAKLDKVAQLSLVQQMTPHLVHEKIGI